MKKMLRTISGYFDSNIWIVSIRTSTAVVQSGIVLIEDLTDKIEAA